MGSSFGKLETQSQTSSGYFVTLGSQGALPVLPEDRDTLLWGCCANYGTWAFPRDEGQLDCDSYRHVAAKQSGFCAALLGNKGARNIPWAP